MKRLHLPPIERDSFTFVGIRVACRMIICDYHHNATAYAQHAPTAVLNLATRQRLLFPTLYGPLVFVAKALSQGYALSEVRCMDVAPAPRALHKRHISR